MNPMMRNIASTIVATLFLFAAQAVSAADAKAPPAQAIDINTASAAELQTLPGIGPSKAQAIIDHRTRRPFKKTEDLMRVKGFGRKTFKKLAPYITVTPPKGVRK